MNCQSKYSDQVVWPLTLSSTGIMRLGFWNEILLKRFTQKTSSATLSLYSGLTWQRCSSLVYTSGINIGCRLPGVVENRACWISTLSLGYRKLTLMPDSKRWKKVIISDFFLSIGHLLLKGVNPWRSAFNSFQTLKLTMNKWAQYPAQMEA